jgi:hypothetical protein
VSRFNQQVSRRAGPRRDAYLLEVTRLALEMRPGIAVCEHSVIFFYNSFLAAQTAADLIVFRQLGAIS